MYDKLIEKMEIINSKLESGLSANTEARAAIYKAAEDSRIAAFAKYNLDFSAQSQIEVANEVAQIETQSNDRENRKEKRNK